MDVHGSARHEVLVVGAGASAVLLCHALHAARLPADVRVTIVGEGHPPGRGVAYSTTDPGHLMNVRAGRLSASAADPGNFVAWLRCRGHRWTAGDYVPRHVYGDYLVDVLDELRRDGGFEVRLETGTVERLHPWSDSVEAQLTDGRLLYADQVVLATGPAPGPPPASVATAADQAMVVDPWAPGALDAVQGADRVLVLGTGLTMVDVVTTLVDQNPRVVVEAISRHGLLPRRHPEEARPTSGPLQLLPGPLTAAGLRRAIVDHAATEPNGWAATVDHVRDTSAQLWARLPAGEQAKLFGHLSREWDVHRHRMAPQVADRIDDLLRDGRLTVSRGQVVDVWVGAAGLHALVETRRSGVRAVAADALVVCAGPVTDITTTTDPLVAQLLADGVAAPGPLRLGLAADGDGWLMDGDGWHQPRLSAIGPLRRGTEWETTAIPDLRAQAQATAEQLVRTLGPVAAAPVSLDSP